MNQLSRVKAPAAAPAREVARSLGRAQAPLDAGQTQAPPSLSRHNLAHMSIGHAVDARAQDSGSYTVGPQPLGRLGSGTELARIVFAGGGGLSGIVRSARLMGLVAHIRGAGPLGAAFITGIDGGGTDTDLHIATSATKRDGTVISLSATGGGLTLRATESASGHIEVYVDPSNLISYNATDGTVATETPTGLLLHEMGHASLLLSGDPAQTTGGPAAEAHVRTLTNPIRAELGVKQDAG